MSARPAGKAFPPTKARPPTKAHPPTKAVPAIEARPATEADPSTKADPLEAPGQNAFNVGWICALKEEMAAAEAMLDETYQDPQYKPQAILIVTH